MSPLAQRLLPIFCGFLLDALLGDPEWLYHPVRLIGRLIVGMERLLRRVFPDVPNALLVAGGVLALAVPVICYIVPWMLLRMAAAIHPILCVTLQCVFCYQILAMCSLVVETRRVAVPLQQGDLSLARQSLSRVVGRDTQSLDAPGIIRGAVETVAENFSDGVIAPLLFLFAGGPALGWCYKAVNTLDSMVGYKNEQYRFFGYCSARLDDIVNWIPARFSAFCLLFASLFPPYHFGDALRIFRRDRYAHASPNSAQTESVCAGALGIQLGGGNYYGGVLVEKPTIGDNCRPPVPGDIGLANRLMVTGSVIALLILTMCSQMLYFFLA